MATMKRAKWIEAAKAEGERVRSTHATAAAEQVKP